MRYLDTDYHGNLKTDSFDKLDESKMINLNSIESVSELSINWRTDKKSSVVRTKKDAKYYIREEVYYDLIELIS